jgi:branched-chain amino acid transport system substrate-binding protein
MKRKSIYTGLTLLTLAALVLSACATATPAPTATAPAATAAPAAATATKPPAPTPTSVPPTETPVPEPIRVGSTLSLTGPLAATAAIHKIIGEIFVEQLNAKGGLLGRPVEWIVLDDESTPDKAAALYERLITEENVDLIIGPYGSGNITAAMQVAERYEMVFIHHTGSLTYAYTYKWHFPMWYTGLNTHKTTPDLLYDALDSTGTPPKTIGFVVNQFPGTMFLARGREGDGGAVQVAQEHGYEVVLDVDFPFGTTDLSAIAAQVRDADPDFLYLAGLGVDGNNLIAAMDALNYKPQGMFVQWPAPGPLAQVGEGVFSVTLFEAHEPFLSYPGARELNEEFGKRATAAGMSYPVLDVQGAVSWATWQTLTSAVEATNSLDQETIADWLLSNKVNTIIGDVTFDANNQNYGPDLQSIKQVRDGRWVVVYPPEFAPEGVTIQYSPQE